MIIYPEKQQNILCYMALAWEKKGEKKETLLTFVEGTSQSSSMFAVLEEAREFVRSGQSLWSSAEE